MREFIKGDWYIILILLVDIYLLIIIVNFGNLIFVLKIILDSGRELNYFRFRGFKYFCKGRGGMVYCFNFFVLFEIWNDFSFLKYFCYINLVFYKISFN